ncbi:hypothetical protein BESB_059390 [Besnoitia besnoiti]|uniref:SSD domain-containing protein n=1 Tax=Besnoitia besnoiti TaxID=94643 RepID=A0A2A9MI29_BESBE|nr:hypothetical protein BESB_059390 [Besnoitia besnoiti]PFH35052.1 hypothetical protein BESB_059390 [Besnoitia besnoiti]
MSCVSKINYECAWPSRYLTDRLSRLADRLAFQIVDHPDFFLRRAAFFGFCFLLVTVGALLFSFGLPSFGDQTVASRHPDGPRFASLSPLWDSQPPANLSPKRGPTSPSAASEEAQVQLIQALEVRALAPLPAANQNSGEVPRASPSAIPELVSAPNESPVTGQVNDKETALHSHQVDDEDPPPPPSPLSASNLLFSSFAPLRSPHAASSELSSSSPEDEGSQSRLSRAWGGDRGGGWGGLVATAVGWRDSRVVARARSWLGRAFHVGYAAGPALFLPQRGDARESGDTLKRFFGEANRVTQLLYVNEETGHRQHTEPEAAQEWDAVPDDAGERAKRGGRRPTEPDEFDTLPRRVSRGESGEDESDVGERGGGGGPRAASDRLNAARGGASPEEPSEANCEGAQPTEGRIVTSLPASRPESRPSPSSSVALLGVECPGGVRGAGEPPMRAGAVRDAEKADDASAARAQEVRRRRLSGDDLGSARTGPLPANSPSAHVLPGLFHSSFSIDTDAPAPSPHSFPSVLSPPSSSPCSLAASVSSAPAASNSRRHVRPNQSSGLLAKSVLREVWASQHAFQTAVKAGSKSWHDLCAATPTATRTVGSVCVASGLFGNYEAVVGVPIDSPQAFDTAFDGAQTNNATLLHYGAAYLSTSSYAPLSLLFDPRGHRKARGIGLQEEPTSTETEQERMMQSAEGESLDTETQKTRDRGGPTEASGERVAALTMVADEMLIADRGRTRGMQGKVTTSLDFRLARADALMFTYELDNHKGRSEDLDAWEVAAMEWVQKENHEKAKALTGEVETAWISGMTADRAQSVGRDRPTSQTVEEGGGGSRHAADEPVRLRQQRHVDSSFVPMSDAAAMSSASPSPLSVSRSSSAALNSGLDEPDARWSVHIFNSQIAFRECGLAAARETPLLLYTVFLVSVFLMSAFAALGVRPLRTCVRLTLGALVVTLFSLSVSFCVCHLLLREPVTPLAPLVVHMLLGLVCHNSILTLLQLRRSSARELRKDETRRAEMAQPHYSAWPAFASACVHASRPSLASSVYAGSVRDGANAAQADGDGVSWAGSAGNSPFAFCPVEQIHGSQPHRIFPPAPGHASAHFSGSVSGDSRLPPSDRPFSFDAPGRAPPPRGPWPPRNDNLASLRADGAQGAPPGFSSASISQQAGLYQLSDCGRVPWQQLLLRSDSKLRALRRVISSSFSSLLLMSLTCVAVLSLTSTLDLPAVAYVARATACVAASGFIFHLFFFCPLLVRLEQPSLAFAVDAIVASPVVITVREGSLTGSDPRETGAGASHAAAERAKSDPKAAGAGGSGQARRDGREGVERACVRCRETAAWRRSECHSEATRTQRELHKPFWPRDHGPVSPRSSLSFIDQTCAPPRAVQPQLGGPAFCHGSDFGAHDSEDSLSDSSSCSAQPAWPPADLGCRHLPSAFCGRPLPVDSAPVLPPLISGLQVFLHSPACLDVPCASPFASCPSRAGDSVRGDALDGAATPPLDLHATGYDRVAGPATLPPAFVTRAIVARPSAEVDSEDSLGSSGASDRLVGGDASPGPATGTARTQPSPTRSGDASVELSGEATPAMQALRGDAPSAARQIQQRRGRATPARELASQYAASDNEAEVVSADSDDSFSLAKEDADIAGIRALERHVTEALLPNQDEEIDARATSPGGGPFRVDSLVARASQRGASAHANPSAGGTRPLGASAGVERLSSRESDGGESGADTPSGDERRCGCPGGTEHGGRGRAGRTQAGNDGDAAPLERERVPGGGDAKRRAGASESVMPCTQNRQPGETADAVRRAAEAKGEERGPNRGRRGERQRRRERKGIRVWDFFARRRNRRIVMTLFSLATVTSGLLCRHLSPFFDILPFLRRDAPLLSFFNAVAFFWPAGMPSAAFLVLPSEDQFEYREAKQRQRIITFLEELEALPEIQGSSRSWITDLEAHVNGTASADASGHVPPAIVPECPYLPANTTARRAFPFDSALHFNSRLREWIADGDNTVCALSSLEQNDTEATASEKAPWLKNVVPPLYKSAYIRLSNNDTRIEASCILLTTLYRPDNPLANVETKRKLERMVQEKLSLDGAFIYANWFEEAERDERIFATVCKQLLLVAGGLGLLLAFLISPAGALFVSLLLTTTSLMIASCLVILGASIDVISLLALFMCATFAAEYGTHVVYLFLHTSEARSQAGSRVPRVVWDGERWKRQPRQLAHPATAVKPSRRAAIRVWKCARRAISTLALSAASKFVGIFLLIFARNFAFRAFCFLTGLALFVSAAAAAIVGPMLLYYLEPLFPTFVPSGRQTRSGIVY